MSCGVSMSNSGYTVGTTVSPGKLDRGSESVGIDGCCVVGPTVNFSTTPVQCSEWDEEGCRKGSFCTGSSGIGIGYLNMYSRESVDRSVTGSEITNFLESNFNSLDKYTVKEPVGYALLMCCKGPKKSTLLSPAVYHDVDHMTAALNHSGWTTLPIKSMLNRDMLLLHVLDRLSLVKLEPFSVFLLYYSGHGNHEGVILDDGSIISYSEIVQHVASIDVLKNKPKIFIFDCCRVNQYQPNHSPVHGLPFHQEIEQRWAVEKRNSLSGYPPPHSLICYSATDYCSSELSEDEGSFYTLTLAHALKQFGKHFSILEIMTQVNGVTHLVAEHFKCGQRPIFISSLDKHLVLSGKKVICTLLLSSSFPSVFQCVCHLFFLCSRCT